MENATGRWAGRGGDAGYFEWEGGGLRILAHKGCVQADLQPTLSLREKDGTPGLME